MRAVFENEHGRPGLLRRAAARLHDGAVHARQPPVQGRSQFAEYLAHGYSAIVTPTTTRLKPRKLFSLPAVEAKPKNHFVLNYRVPTKAGTEKAHLGFSLVVVGVTESE